MSFFLTSANVIDLGVNIDHVATLRNARGTTYPDPVRAALAAEDAGADAITLHLREDRRHIVDADVRTLRTQLRTRMNLECALTQEMLDTIDALETDKVICDGLGTDLAREFIRLKRMEWTEYSRHVSDWESRRYLEFC